MSLEKIINDAWEKKDQVNQDSDQSLKDVVNQIINDLDNGNLRVAEKINGEWITHQYLKKAIMLSFRIYPMDNLSGPYSSWYDKAHLLKGKTANWTKEQHEAAGFRMTPNSPVRPGSFIGKNAVLMPCYVNIGAYIGAGTMAVKYGTMKTVITGLTVVLPNGDICLLYTSPSPRDGLLSRMPSSA